MDLAQFYKKYFQPGALTTDSRKVKPGDIFVALRGDNFDGNRYAEQALRSGAKLAVVDDRAHKDEPSLYKVADSLHFLQQLANYHRKQQKFPVIGLTGTNGKTTTKELMHAILKQKFRTHATAGNLNNHIGVPLTLLSTPADTQMCIIEMGANHPGEIEALCKIADPDCGLITNIGLAHLEGFGSFEGVKNTKAELFKYLKRKGGKIFFNAADAILTSLIGGYENSLPYDSIESLYARIKRIHPTLSLELFFDDAYSLPVKTHLFGEYNIQNILAAAAVGIHFGVSPEQIKQGVENYQPSNYRSQFIELNSKRIILDCYNANPTSMGIALQDFARMPQKRKVAILGSMKELGEYSAEEHQKLIRLAESFQFNHILLIGDEFDVPANTSLHHFSTADEAKVYLREMDLTDSCILIKGSRANQLEKLLDTLND